MVFTSKTWNEVQDYTWEYVSFFAWAEEDEVRRLLLDYLPEHVRNLNALEAIYTAEQDFVNKLWNAVDGILQNSYIETLDNYGCEKWEKWLNLKNAKTKTLQERRFNIALFLLGLRPFTFRKLKKILTQICGEGGFTVSINDYFLSVNLKAKTATNITDLNVFLLSIIPENITLKIERIATRHIDLHPYTHSELSAKTHGYFKMNDINEEGL